MEIVLEVPDQDVARVLELIRGIKRVKVKSPKKARRPPAELLDGLREAVQDVKKFQRGEMELQSWDELYTDLQTGQVFGEPSTTTSPPNDKNIAEPLSLPNQRKQA